MIFSILLTNTPTVINTGKNSIPCTSLIPRKHNWLFGLTAITDCMRIRSHSVDLILLASAWRIGINLAV